MSGISSGMSDRFLFGACHLANLQEATVAPSRIRSHITKIWCPERLWQLNGYVSRAG
jgi:hypothetical protein